eukprot:GGOE01065363.1.p1 GENE.GGOE01065363.1~~GGOE01065363.1.p1  ORF type:complete len:356 (+),score=76.87 GGOE01065363.1:49-1068(+)
MFKLKSVDSPLEEDTRHLHPESPVMVESPEEPVFPAADCAACTDPNPAFDADCTPSVVVPPEFSTAQRPEPWYNLHGDMMGWYIRTISINSIPIHVHPLLFAVWILNIFQGLAYGAAGILYFFILYGPILFGTVLLHELGHALAARQLHQEVHRILLWPLGGLAFIGHSETSTPRDDLIIALAGPLTHVPQILFWLMLALISGGVHWAVVYIDGSLFCAICNGAMQLNTILLLFNLCLPCYPLDGGRILVAAMLLKGVSIETTAKACIYISIGIAGIGMLYAIASLNLFLILITLWVMFQVYQVWILLRAGGIHSHPLFHNAAAFSSAPPRTQPAGLVV